MILLLVGSKKKKIIFSFSFLTLEGEHQDEMSEACHAPNEGLPTSPQHPQAEAGCQNSSRCARSRRRCLNQNRCLNRFLNPGDQSCLLRPSSCCVDLQTKLRCDAAGRWREQRTSVRAGFLVTLLMYVLSRLSVRVSLAIRRVWYCFLSSGLHW